LSVSVRGISARLRVGSGHPVCVGRVSIGVARVRGHVWSVCRGVVVGTFVESGGRKVGSYVGSEPPDPLRRGENNRPVGRFSGA
jgi:hypothetical protein